MDTDEWMAWPDDWRAPCVPRDQFDIPGEDQVDMTWLRWSYGACVAGKDPAADWMKQTVRDVTSCLDV